MFESGIHKSIGVKIHNLEAAVPLLNANNVKERDQDGNLPLHAAIYYGSYKKSCQLKLVKELLTLYPEGARQKNNDGQLPVHFCQKHSLRRTPKDFFDEKYCKAVKCLLEAYPESLSVEDEKGTLPLRCAVENYSFISYLIGNHPEWIKTVDRKGNFPLHHVLWKGADAKIIELCIEAFPKALRVKNEDGNFPLHVAARNGSSATCIQLLVQKYPGALKSKNKNGLSPLFQSVEYGDGTREVLEILYADNAQKKDRKGDLPLHRAICLGMSSFSNASASKPLVDALLKLYPEGARQKNNGGQLPIHKFEIISRFNKRQTLLLKLAECLLKEFPESLSVEDKKGELPLRRGIEKFNSSFITYIIRNHPMWIKTADRKGNLPLHDILREGAQARLVKLCIEAFPEALKAKNKEGNLPLHIAAMTCNAACTQLLVQKYPGAIKTRNRKGNTPLVASIEERTSIPDMVEKIKVFAEACPQILAIDGDYNPVLDYFKGAPNMARRRLTVASALMDYCIPKPVGDLKHVKVLQDEIKTQKTQLQSISSEMQAAKQKFEASASELTTAKAQLQQMQTTNQKLEETTNELTAAKAHFQQKCQTLGSTINELRAANAQLQQMHQTQRMQTSNEKLEATKNELKAAKTQLQNTANHLHCQTDLLSKTRSSEISFITKIKEKRQSWELEDLVVLLESLSDRLDSLRRQLHPDRKPSKSQKLVKYMLMLRTKGVELECDDVLDNITDINQELMELENEALAFMEELAATNVAGSSGSINTEAATAVIADEEIERSRVRLFDGSGDNLARKRARVSISP